MSGLNFTEETRKLFPASENVLYLDCGLQSPMSLPVKAQLDLFNNESLESGGPKYVWLKRVEDTRNKLAHFINARSEEIAFTKNTTEALNIAANALPLKKGDNVLMLRGDHPNNAYAFLNLQKKGVEVRFVPMTDRVNDETFLSMIDENTKAISMSHVTFHAGHQFDIESVSRLCRARNLYFIVDIMQSIGVVPIDVKKIDATFLCSGTHKGLLVPQGLGFIWWNCKDTSFHPAYLGAASIDNSSEHLVAGIEHLTLAANAKRFELGNFNIPAILALSASLDLINNIGVANIQSHYYDLGDYLIAELEKLGVDLVGPKQRELRSPHIYVLRLKNVEAWIDYFSKKNVRCSPEAEGVRVSFGLFNNKSDIEKFLNILSIGLKEI